MMKLNTYLGVSSVKSNTKMRGLLTKVLFRSARMLWNNSSFKNWRKFWEKTKISHILNFIFMKKTLNLRDGTMIPTTKVNRRDHLNALKSLKNMNLLNKVLYRKMKVPTVRKCIGQHPSMWTMLTSNQKNLRWKTACY